MKSRIETRKIADLKTTMFVRSALNQDHVLFLAELIEGGTVLPPIQITEDGRIIDGRHRKEAYELLDRTEVKVEVVGETDETKLITMAFKANVGGSLPPTIEDVNHTIQVLLEKRVPQCQIAKLLRLPPSMSDKLVSRVKTRITRTKKQDAVDAVTERGLTISAAAKQFGVPFEDVRNELRRRKKKDTSVAEHMRNLTAFYRTLGQRTAHILRATMDEFRDGEMSASQVDEVFKKIEQLQVKSARSIKDWETRFEAAKANGDEAADQTNQTGSDKKADKDVA